MRLTNDTDEWYGSRETVSMVGEGREEEQCGADPSRLV